MIEPRSLRIYRSLLHLFPKHFRKLWATPMENFFLDMRREHINKGRRLGAGFWAALLWDTARGALAAWATLLRNDFSPEFAPSSRQPMGEAMSALFSDIRLGLRQLARRPMYALLVVLLMTVGIAGNAAVFRVFNGLFLRSLPFEKSEQLVDLNETAPQWNLEYLMIAYRDFDTWRAENDTFQSLAVYDKAGGNFMVDGSPQRVSFLNTSHDMAEVLGLQPHLGRFYGATEDHPDGPRVMMLSRAYWLQEFGGDEDVLGRTLSLNGVPTEIIGVLPREASFLADVQMWLPLRKVRSDWDGWGLNGIGRLKPEVTIQQARDNLLAIHKGMIEEFDVNEISSPVVDSLRSRYLGKYRLGSGFLLAAVGAVLLIACANIAGLMMVRSLARRQEMAMRIALGASRRRIVQQLLTEGLVLAIIGATAGTVLGVLGSNALVVPMAEQFPRWVNFDLDARFFFFSVAVTVGAALLFGLAPALQASRSPRGMVASSRVTGNRMQRRAMGGLVAGQIAIALALLVLGGLSVMDVRQLGRVDPGFQAEGLVSYSLTLPATRYADHEARLAFVDQYLPQLEAISGVRSAAVASSVPLSGHWGTLFMVDGAPARASEEANPVVLNRIVSPNYFETLGIEFAAGRRFDNFDGREDGSQSIIVNEKFVKTHLGHLKDPLGAQITQGTGITDHARWMTVVGVTRDVKHYGVDEEMRPGVYAPLRQRGLQRFHVALRVQGESGPVIAQARAVTAALDAELPVYNTQAMTEQLDKALWTRRATSWVIGAFSTVALLLAIAGIYGVISYGVSQRTQEIGIRIAMGAQRGHILRLILGQGMVLVIGGVILGLAASIALAGKVGALLVGGSAANPLVYLGVTTLLMAVAALANYLPARRAASIEPMRALRGD